MTLAHMTTPLLGVADAAVIGRLGQAHLLGAIAAAAVIFDFLFWSFGFLRMGTAGLTAQALGAGDKAEQRATLQRALIVGVLIGAAMICLQVPIAWIGFGALAASPEVTDAGRLYFDIRIWSAPFALANYAFMGAIVGRGRTDIALALQVMINLGNIALNVAFVYGLSLGVRGSAAGTLAAEVLGALAGLFVVWRMYGDLFSVARRQIFDREKIARMFAINRDIFIRTAALLFAFAFFTVARRAGRRYRSRGQCDFAKPRSRGGLLSRRFRDGGGANVRAIARGAGCEELSRLRALDVLVVFHFRGWLVAGRAAFWQCLHRVSDDQSASANLCKRVSCVCRAGAARRRPCL